MEQTKEISRTKRIVQIVLTVLYYIFIVVLLSFSIITIASKDEGKIPNLFGRGYLSIVSDSMTGDNEDSFNEGDLIYVRILNDNRREELKVGDVVTFYDYALRAFNTHRIVEINETSVGKSVVTQGDKAGAPRDAARPIEDILAVYSGKREGGGLLMFLNTRLGFGLLIVLPVFILFVVQGVRIYLLYKNNKGEQVAIDLEAEKEKIRAQILQELAEEEKKKDDSDK